jgi:uncharacterized phage protein gp47/JayE
MSTTYLTPTDIALQYLVYLKNLKPEVNTAQTDSDWWVRSRVVGGVFSGIYADQQRISTDAFPQSARHDALGNHLETQFGAGFIAAQPAVGLVQFTGASGSVVSVGQQISYDANGNIYAATGTTNFGTATSIAIPVQSIATGQNQNLLPGTVLTVISPPAGVNPTATVVGGALSDGRDDETDPEAALRVLTQIRSPIAGGKVADYVQFALDADPSVTSANILRFPFGLGTVGVVITAGTTDIDAALNAGSAIILTPSVALVAAVQAYVNTENPVTDCATVLGPVGVPIAVTVLVRYASGNGATLVNDPLSGNPQTQDFMVSREIQRAIWKTPPGGRQFDGQGYVLASDIAEQIDYNLSAQLSAGSVMQIVTDRQVQPLSSSGANVGILGTQYAMPGVLTITDLS